MQNWTGIWASCAAISLACVLLFAALLSPQRSRNGKTSCRSERARSAERVRGECTACPRRRPDDDRPGVGGSSPAVGQPIGRHAHAARVGRVLHGGLGGCDAGRDTRAFPSGCAAPPSPTATRRKSIGLVCPRPKSARFTAVSEEVAGEMACGSPATVRRKPIWPYRSPVISGPDAPAVVSMGSSGWATARRSGAPGRTAPARSGYSADQPNSRVERQRESGDLFVMRRIVASVVLGPLRRVFPARPSPIRGLSRRESPAQSKIPAPNWSLPRWGGSLAGCCDGAMCGRRGSTSAG